jgi:hypothetical protein
MAMVDDKMGFLKLSFAESGAFFKQDKHNKGGGGGSGQKSYLDCFEKKYLKCIISETAVLFC